MNSFGFIIHPIDPKRDVARKFPFLGRLLTERQIHFFSTFFPPVFLSRATGMRSMHTGQEVEGWFVACPYTPLRMAQLPTEKVYRKITQSGRLAERLGAQIIGLGAHTSVIGDAGWTISRRLDVPVTTGGSFTVSVAVEALTFAGRQLEIELPRATAAVVGATGTIGAAAAELLAEAVRCLILVGRDEARLAALARELRYLRAEVWTTTDLACVREADLVLSASSAPAPILGVEHFAPGAVVCDIARPRDVRGEVVSRRQDVLVIDGGLVEVPGAVDYGFDFGFPPGMTYACMAEAIALAMEGRFEDFTLGRHLQPERIREIADIASRHGFRLGRLHSFNRRLTDTDLQQARQRAVEARFVKRGVL